MKFNIDRNEEEALLVPLTKGALRIQELLVKE